MNELECYKKIYGDLVLEVPHYNLIFIPGVPLMCFSGRKKIDIRPGAINTMESLNLAKYLTKEQRCQK
jgi:hypothetical protein